MNPLASLLQEACSKGPLPAGEVMRLALYHPDFGYYRRCEGPWGFEGKDYYTALDGGPLLGAALALRLEQVWERLGCPESFTVLEPGAGRGWLGRDVLASAKGAFGDALTYLHRDDNPAARAAAEEALEPWLKLGKARFVPEHAPLPAFVGAVISNELFDALPAQPWRWTGEVWEWEVLTTQGPSWEVAAPGAAGAWFEAQAEGGLQPEDGSVWCEALPGVVRSLTEPLVAGLVLTVDYGESAPRLLAKGADLRRYRAHQVDGAWWEALGEADLTADVDFTRLSACLTSEGLEVSNLQSLGRWVRQHAPLSTWEMEWQALEPSRRMKRMENLLQLTLPGMMGDRFKVLEAWKG